MTTCLLTTISALPIKPLVCTLCIWVLPSPSLPTTLHNTLQFSIMNKFTDSVDERLSEQSVFLTWLEGKYEISDHFVESKVYHLIFHSLLV